MWDSSVGLGEDARRTRSGVVTVVVYTLKFSIACELGWMSGAFWSKKYGDPALLALGMGWYPACYRIVLSFFLA
jgi:hypothetical protein